MKERRKEHIFCRLQQFALGHLFVKNTIPPIQITTPSIFGLGIEEVRKKKIRGVKLTFSGSDAFKTNAGPSKSPRDFRAPFPMGIVR